jgi:hypothetical protein
VTFSLTPQDAQLSLFLPSVGLFLAPKMVFSEPSSENPRAEPGSRFFFLITSSVSSQFQSHGTHTNVFFFFFSDDVFKSVKYGVWASTDTGNKRLDKAYKEFSEQGSIYLFFSVNSR